MFPQSIDDYFSSIKNKVCNTHAESKYGQKYTCALNISNEPCTFFCVWADWTLLGTTETTQQKLKYDTFEGNFGQILLTLRLCILF